MKISTCPPPCLRNAMRDTIHAGCQAGKCTHAWRLRRGVVARDRADPRQAKEVARELMTRCGTWHAPASKSTRDTVDACLSHPSKPKETRVGHLVGGKGACEAVFGGFSLLRTPWNFK